HNNGTQRELIGIVNTMLTYSGQPLNFGAYGDGSSFADLTYYRDAINKIMFPYDGQPTRMRDYSSVAGDVNLDGSLTAAAITAFIQGWNLAPTTPNVET